MKTTRNVTVTAGPLTVGAYVEGASTITIKGRTRQGTWAGTFAGIRPSEHDGADYAYFTDGHINGVPQRIHGFPVAQMGA